jgi:casein kinase II subunit beta
MPNEAAVENESGEQSWEECTSSDDDQDVSWIVWFCTRKGNEFFTEVEREFVEDHFNLYGLKNQVPYYNHALDLILDVERMDMVLSEEQQEKVEMSAEVLYGLIHARYVLTSAGLAAVLEKYQNVEYGRCPHVLCEGQPVLPVGQSDVPRVSTVKVYCPRCKDIFYPRSSSNGRIDGAYFTTTLPHLLLMTYPDLVPAAPTQKYVPRIFGYRVHKSAPQNQSATAAAEKTTADTGGATVTQASTVKKEKRLNTKDVSTPASENPDRKSEKGGS